MPYHAAYQHPNFSQSAPRGPNWARVAAAKDGNNYSGAAVFINSKTGEEAACPAGIWYNLPPADYAKGLRFNAERNDDCAAHKDREGKPWSAGEAGRNRHQARRLRAMALLCDRSGALTAGEVNFLGLTDPGTPRDREEQTCAAIETGEA